MSKLATTRLRNSRLSFITDLPPDWVVYKTSHLFKISMGQTILKEDLIEDGR
jgi:hypothetical protein